MIHEPTEAKPHTPVGLQNGTAKVCAVVIAYFPDTGFKDRLLQILSQVDALVVVDNTPRGDDAWRSEMPADDLARIQLIENRENLGIAKALNQGLAHAVSIKHRWILTLDQDTQCYPDMVRTLLEATAACTPEPAVTGGNYFDPKMGRHEAPTAAANNCIERKTVITSGCLVESAFAHSIGGFREDYFIDQVDNEFCLRVRAHGGRVVITAKPVMNHSVGGHSGPKVPFFGMTLPDHSPLRKYYITRNSVVTVRTYWKAEPIWCLKRLIRLMLGLPGMVLLERYKLTKTKAFAVGFVDGLNRRMGPCKKKWLMM